MSFSGKSRILIRSRSAHWIRTLTFDPLPHRERGRTEQSDGGLTMNEPLSILRFALVLLEIER